MVSQPLDFNAVTWQTPIGDALRYRWKLALVTFISLAVVFALGQMRFLPGAAVHRLPSQSEPARMVTANRGSTLQQASSPLPAAPRGISRWLAPPHSQRQTAREVQSMRDELLTAQTDAEAIERDLAAAQVAIVHVPVPDMVSVDNPEWTTRAAQARVAHAALATLQERYTDLYPDVIKARERASDADRRTAEVPRTHSVPAPVREHPEDAQAQAKIDALQIRRTEISASIISITAAIDGLSHNSSAQSLRRSDVYAAGVKDRTVPAIPAATSSDVVVPPLDVQAAALPQRAPSGTVYPSVRMLIMACLLSLVLTAGLIAIVEVRDATVKSPESLAAMLKASRMALSLGVIGPMQR